MQYFFILGKNPILSKAEIEAVLNSQGLRFKNSELSNNVFIIEVMKEFDIDQLNQRLGGTVKIGKIIDKISNLEKVADKFCSLTACQAGKLHFGFSVYPLADKINLNKQLQKLRPVAMEIKRKLREEKHLNSRWVVSKEPQLSSVIVKKNQLLKYGSEICFFIKDKEILVGQTLAVQQFEEFGARDYARPSRDDISGMLPPKLARLMINLAQIKEDALILDPFCGSGTILQEAIVLGYKNLTGTDNSEKAVENTKKNLDWLLSKSRAASSDPLTVVRVTGSAVKVKNLDVKDLSQEFKPNSIDAIITEPYLGPPLKGKETVEQINSNITELEKLYEKAFAEFTKVLKPKGKIVIVIPEFRIKNQIKTLNLQSIKNYKFLNKEKLVYSRPNQYVWRQVQIWQKI